MFQIICWAPLQAYRSSISFLGKFKLYINKKMDLKKECERVLKQNWRGGYTVPSPNLYPFQWNWDSGFIALGWIHLEPERAIQEMEHLFMGQWKNGFLPHIVFHNAEKYGADYYPSADIWDSRVADLSPKDVKTTGISQPPIHGFVLERIIQSAGLNDRVKELFKKVVALHKYYYKVRDTDGCGLVNVWHNWETGMDNAPWWDHVLGRISDRDIEDIVLDRKDVKVVKDHQETRPSDEEYKRYMWLVEELRKGKYESISSTFPFQVYDLAFNSIFLASGDSLVRIGGELSEDMEWLVHNLEKGRNSFRELMWNEEQKCFYPYDLIAKSQICNLGAASFLPLFAGVPMAMEAKALIKHLKFEKGNVVPSFDPDQPEYELKKYWRGPIWVNLNYMIWVGLERYGYLEEAGMLKQRTLQIVEKYGIREYYPVDEGAKEAYGAHDFSWTASIVLDLLNE